MTRQSDQVGSQPALGWLQMMVQLNAAEAPATLSS
jgi:hypothetical protein